MQETQKITKKEQAAKQRETEEVQAKTMSYDAIVQNIANAKKAISVLQEDINGLVKKRLEQEALVSKMNRIMSYKKRLMGA